MRACPTMAQQAWSPAIKPAGSSNISLPFLQNADWEAAPAEFILAESKDGGCGGLGGHLHVLQQHETLNAHLLHCQTGM